MTPQEFCSKWDIKRSQLADLLCLAQGTVDHWFSAKSKRQPPADVLKRLDEYDGLLEDWLELHRNLHQFRAERFPILYTIFLKSIAED